jgi:4-aminobutyrate aminotransferase
MSKKEQYVCRTPGKKSRSIIARDKKIISPSVTREYSFVYKKAKGMYVWDVDGRKYLDFAAGIAAMNVGHTNSEVVQAIQKQLKEGMHAAFSDFYAELPVQYAEQLVKAAGTGMKKVFFSNSGTESVEAAYKLARWHTKKKWVIAYKNAFHGRTMGSLSLTNSKPVQRERFDPFMPVKHVEFPYHYRNPHGKTAEETGNYCLEQLEKTMKQLKGDLAALFMEPIQGEGGYIVPPKSFMRGVKELTERHNVLLCMDEVQSGCNRTGKFLATNHFKIKPDIVSVSKAIGGGIPLGATLAREDIMDWVPGSHANTFGGNLIACAAGSATLQYMKKHHLAENATTQGNVIMKTLKQALPELKMLGDVRGKGLMIGVEIVKNKTTKTPGKSERSAILCKAAEKGLILLSAGMSTIRICPPLILTKTQAKQGTEILQEAMQFY